MAGPWYAHFPADYERKTSHLTMLEDGAYRRMLDHYYATAKPLPLSAEHLYRICRAFADEERVAIDAVLKMFFVRKRDGYHNKRADEEIAKAAELGEKRRNAALSRYAKAPAIAERLDTPSPSPSQTQKEQPKSIDRASRVTPRSRHRLPDNCPNDNQKDEAVEFWGTQARFDLATSIKTQADQFRDHHLKLGSTMADWGAAWRTWYRNALKYNRPECPNGRPESPHRQSDRIARELLEEFNARDAATNPDACPRPGLVVLREGLGGGPEVSPVAPDVRRLVGPHRG